MGSGVSKAEITTADAIATKMRKISNQWTRFSGVYLEVFLDKELIMFKLSVGGHGEELSRSLSPPLLAFRQDFCLAV